MHPLDNAHAERTKQRDLSAWAGPFFIPNYVGLLKRGHSLSLLTSRCGIYAHTEAIELIELAVIAERAHRLNGTKGLTVYEELYPHGIGLNGQIDGLVLAGLFCHDGALSFLAFGQAYEVPAFHQCVIAIGSAIERKACPLVILFRSKGYFATE